MMKCTGVQLTRSGNQSVPSRSIRNTQRQPKFQTWWSCARVRNPTVDFNLESLGLMICAETYAQKVMGTLCAKHSGFISSFWVDRVYRQQRQGFSRSG